ncbi:CubicO group peptidase (beta-lactamase class C family) [Fontibacillus phaseoli]|uniref:CubicO group peptidase (Beta-lactamase class C family) n=1 Tax=Fontibacillus phaseoli TaxID=1416533 RepID=A0A369B5T6_9BACL|nr:serine hydrolase domain-containing protein [Fontibacillus phaseoli]RCX16685.1 CubicO group peptidase (beta-lactamase class C family) [Fontibacillus phaseoli]
MKRIAYWLLILWIGLILPGGAATVVNAAPDTTLTADQLEQVVDNVMEANMDKLHIAGSAVVVTQGDDILFSKGYGYGDVEHRVPMDPASTLIRIGSLTKPMVAAAVMQEVERGLLSTDTDINQYLKTFKVPVFGKRPITLHDLLTHTSGLDQVMYNVVSLSEGKTVPASEFLRQYFLKQSPVREPGEQYDYNNINFGLVGNLIEQTSGQTLNDYLTEQLFKPLGMPSVSMEKGSVVPKSYQYAGEGNYRLLPYEHFNIPGGGAINVVPNEFAHFMVAQLNQGLYKGQAIMKPETIQSMQDLQYTAHPQLDGFGYGLMRGKLANGMPILWYTGDVEGFSSKMVLIPSERVGIYVVVNTGEGGSLLYEQVIGGIEKLMDGGAVPEEPEVSAGDLKQYEGRYAYRLSPQHGWGKWITFFERNSFDVKPAGNKLEVSGVFPLGSGKVEHRTFYSIGDQVFREQGGSQKLWFHQVEGTWKMTGIDSATLEKTGFWRQSSTLLMVLAGICCFWIGLAVVYLVRYLVRFIRKGKRPISGKIAAISLLFAVYLPVQVIYGLMKVTYGFPLWYRWGIGSLPLVAFGIAVYMLVGALSNRALGKWTIAGRVFIAGITVFCTVYLFYWNMLPFHYS